MFKYFVALTLSLQAWGLHTGTPVTVSDPRLNSSQPEVAIDAQGRAAVAWISDHDYRLEALYVVSKDEEGNPWSDGKRLSDWEYEVYLHRCQFDSSGNLSLLWGIEVETAGDEIDDYMQWVTKHVGEAWGISEKGKYFSPDSVAFEPNGQMIATHVEYSPKDNWQHEYLVQCSPFPFTEDQKTTIHSSKKYIFASPKIIVDQEGNGLIYWMNTDSTSEGLFSRLVGSWRTAENKWTQPETICSFKGGYLYLFDTKTALRGDKNAVFIFKNEDKLNAMVHSDGKWSEVAELANFQDSPFADMAAEIDSKGNALVVWKSRSGDKEVVCAAYKAAGQPWSAPFEVSELKREVDHLCIADDGAGNFILVWEQLKRNSYRVWGAQFSIADAKMSKPVKLSPPGKSCYSPSIAFAEGKGIISWVNRENGFDSVVKVVQIADLFID